MSEPPPLPTHAYLPGQTPRHPEGTFDQLRESARAGMSAAALARSAAFRAGLYYLEKGYFWEAHELLEPVWMALPHGMPERHVLQALIQLANARLKARMQRPRAVARLGAMVLRHLEDCRDAGGGAWVMGVALAPIRAEAEAMAAGG